MLDYLLRPSPFYTLPFAYYNVEVEEPESLLVPSSYVHFVSTPMMNEDAKALCRHKQLHVSFGERERERNKNYRVQFPAGSLLIFLSLSPKLTS